MAEQQLEYLKSLGINITPSKDEGEIGFKPLRGGYKGEIKRIEHKTGSNSFGDFDKWSLAIQITQTLEGDKGDNRWLFKEYNNLAYKDPNGKFETKALDGSRNLIRDLNVTSSLPFHFENGDNEITIIEKNKELVKGATVYFRTYPKKNKQIIIIVDQLKINNPFADKKQDEIPF